MKYPLEGRLNQTAAFLSIFIWERQCWIQIFSKLRLEDLLSAFNSQFCFSFLLNSSKLHILLPFFFLVEFLILSFPSFLFYLYRCCRKQCAINPVLQRKSWSTDGPQVMDSKVISLPVWLRGVSRCVQADDSSCNQGNVLVTSPNGSWRTAVCKLRRKMYSQSLIPQFKIEAFKAAWRIASRI